MVPPRQLDPDPSRPFVRIVVVDFHGHELTRRCVAAIAATDWDPDRAEIVVVDNGGGLEPLTTDSIPVRIARPGRNLGFAEGCNLGMGDLAGVDFVALVNNDALVEPGWLTALVSAIDVSTMVGAVNPKVLLDRRYHHLTVASRTPAEVAVTAVRRGGSAVDDVVYGPRFEERDGGRVTTAEELVLVVGDEAANVNLEVSASTPTTVTISSGTTSVSAELTTEPALIAIDVSPAVDTVNSAGGVVLPGWYGADRGYLEPDDGRYASEAEIDTWTGSAVLLRAAYLDDVGRFDERLFLYYEDFDLAARGRRRGWRYRYTPATVIRHARGSTAGRDSSFHRYHDHRNRLVAVARSAPPREAMRVIARDLRATASYTRRDVVRPLLALHRPSTSTVGDRLRSTASFLRLLPGTLARRRADRTRR